MHTHKQQMMIWSFIQKNNKIKGVCWSHIFSSRETIFLAWEQQMLEQMFWEIKRTWEKYFYNESEF